MLEIEKIRTAEEALVRAVIAANTEPPTSRLHDVRFGQYSAEGEGWYWSMEFIRAIGSAEHVQAEELYPRLMRIISRWREDTAIVHAFEKKELRS